MAECLDAETPPTLVEFLLHIFSETVHDEEAVGEACMAVLALSYVLGDGEVGQLMR